MVAWQPSVEGRTSKAKGKGERPRCTHCGKVGHLRETCYDLIGYPAHWNMPHSRRDWPATGSGKSASVEVAKGMAVQADPVASPSPAFAGLMLAQQQQLAQFVEYLNGGNFGSNIPIAGKTESGTVSFAPSLSSHWLFDSGTNAHIVNNLSMLPLLLMIKWQLLCKYQMVHMCQFESLALSSSQIL